MAIRVDRLSLSLSAETLTARAPVKNIEEAIPPDSEESTPIRVIGVTHEGRPARLMTPRGEVTIGYLPNGRPSGIRLHGLGFSLDFGYTQGGAPLSVAKRDLHTGALLSYRIAPGLFAEQNKYQWRALSPEDDQEELLRMAAETICNPWSFVLPWDFLEDWRKDDESRRRCMEDCAAKCDAGDWVWGILMGGVCGLLTPGVLPGAACGAVGVGLSVWFKAKCLKDCEWRCR